MLKFYLITDTHLWSVKRMGPSGHIDQTCTDESEAIIDSAFDILAAKEDSDIILIAGDLTKSGERPNHEEMIKKLCALKEKGKRVYVITATHDYGLRGVDDDGNTIGEDDGSVVRREELREMYKDFGFNEAIAEDKRSMSYVVQLADGYRLLCLNDDGNGKSFCGYYTETMNWIKEQLAKAKQDGQFIFAMTHHPVLPPFPAYPLVSRRDMLGEYEKASAELADAGLRYIFTGHTHCQNIDSIVTPKGNRLYDINTGALCGYPAPIRSVVIDDRAMNITTEHVEDFEWDKGGLDAATFMKNRFNQLLVGIFDSMENDFDDFCGYAGGFSVERSSIEKFKMPIMKIGKFINHLTFKKLGKMLFIGSSIDFSIENVLVKDFLIEAINNIWAGNEIYGRETPYGRAVYALGKRLNPVAKPFLKKAGINDLADFLLSLLYDETPDTDAVLPFEG